MSDKQTLPYGSWPSPLSIELAVGSSRGLSEPLPDGEDIYLLESRPEEKGRVVLLRRTPDGELADMAPGLNVRSRVHEYGGGAYTVTESGPDGYGVTGIVYDADLDVISISNLALPTAIDIADQNLQAGDVITVSLHVQGPQGTGSCNSAVNINESAELS